MKATVLDSYAVIAYLQKQNKYEDVAELFDECITKNHEVFLCVINWGEVLYQALRTGGESRMRLADDVMRALPIQIIEANKDLTLQAARLKASKKMSYADCFAAAVAMEKKCDLMTGDKEFKQVADEIKIRWI